MPCLTDFQISSVLELIDLVYGFLNQHVDVKSGASRFGELDAFFQQDLIGGLIPCGKVASDQDSIAIGGIRLGNLDTAKEILLSATPDGATESDDFCQDLIDAIRNIKIDWSTVSPYLKNELNIFAPTLVNSIEKKVINQLSIINDYNADILLEIHNVWSKVNAISITVGDINSRLESRSIEILQRIHDTRVELKQTAIRVIDLWDCLLHEDSTPGNPICKPNIDIEELTISLLEGLSIFLNPLFLMEDSFKKYVFNEISNLSVTLVDSIGDCCQELSLLIDKESKRLVATINSPGWLALLNSRIESLLAYSEEQVNSLNGFHTRLITITEAINSLAQVTQDGDIVNYVYNNTTNYYIGEAETEPSTIDIAAILAAIASVRSLVEEITRCVCIEFSGQLSIAGCPGESATILSYEGKSLKGIESQISTATKLLDEVGQRTCDGGSPILLLPSDKYGSADCDRQLTIYFVLIDKYPYFTGSTWSISLPNPRNDLTWKDFENWIWAKGQYTHSVIFSLDNGKTYSRKNSSWGAFKSREDGIQFFDRALGLLEPTEHQRANGDGRMKKRIPTAVIQCVRAFVSEIDNQTGAKIRVQCYAPPKG